MTTPNEEKAYVVVRADIPVGYQIVQAAHAVAEHEKENPGSMAGRTMVVLQVPNEVLLRLLFEYYNKTYEVPATMFWEPDIEEYTAFAASPSSHCHVFKNMKLAGSS